MPPGFAFPDDSTQLWMLITADPRWPSFERFHVADAFCALGRLKSEVSVEQARAEMNAIAGRLSSQYPATDSGLGVRVVPLFQQSRGRRFAAPSGFSAGPFSACFSSPA